MSLSKWVLLTFVVWLKCSVGQWYDDCFMDYLMEKREEGPCECVEIAHHSLNGHFYCINNNLTHLPISELPKNRCRDIHVASLQRNWFSDYPLLVRDPRFVRVNLEENHLTSLPKPHQVSKRLKYLNLSKNKISNTTHDLRNMIQLKSLYVSWNTLTSLEFLPNPCYIQILDVSGNILRSVESLKSCRLLEYLQLSNNLLTSIPKEVFDSFRNLVFLYLNNNPLTTLADNLFLGLKRLHVLCLNNVKLTHLSKDTFNGLVSLNELSLSNNRLTTLPEAIFSSFGNISDINLSDNQLAFLTSRVFARLHQLQYLDLARNNLTYIPATIFYKGRSLYVNMQENPIQVESLRWIEQSSHVRPGFDLDACKCGFLDVWSSRVDFCVDIECGDGEKYLNWRLAVAAYYDEATSANGADAATATGDQR